MDSASTLSAILNLSGLKLLGKFMVSQKFQDSPFTGDFLFVQTKELIRTHH